MTISPPDNASPISAVADRQDDGLAHRCPAQLWADLHQQAALLARIADLAPEIASHSPDALRLMLGRANPWQRELVQRGVEDMDAMMRPGLAALRTVTARGCNATSPALALWREFHAARTAVLALLDAAEPVRERDVA